MRACYPGMRRGADCLRQCEPDSASFVVFRGQKLKTERRARRSRRARSEARVAAPKNPPSDEGGFGAATRIRTGDLILTKDVLYQLSHSSRLKTCFRLVYYIKRKRVCQPLKQKYFNFFEIFLKSLKFVDFARVLMYTLIVTRALVAERKIWEVKIRAL